VDDLLPQVNDLLSIIVAVIGIYEFVSKTLRSEVFDRAVVAGAVLSLFLIGLAFWLGTYKPIVPKSSSEIVKAEEDTAPERLPHPPSTPETIRKTYTLNVKNHIYRGFKPSSRSYERRFKAELGYKIVSYDWIPTSTKNASGVSLSIESGGAEVVVSFTLMAGSVFDRSTGSINGLIKTSQVKRV